MGTYDDLYGKLRTAAAPTATPDAATFMRSLVNAAAADEKANPTNLWSWVTGSGRDAAIAKATAAAPGAWQQFLQAQNATRGAQLGTARDFATTGAMAGVNIDPSNPMASIPALTSAYGGVFNGSPAGTPAATAGVSAAPVDPVQAQRAQFMKWARFNQIANNPQAATDYFKLANAGLPEGTMLRPDGTVGDGVTGAPVGVDVGTLQAGRAGQKVAAEEAPRVAGQMRIAGNQAGLDRQTAAIENADKARYDQITGFDKTNGQPLTISKSQYANGAAPNFVAGDNPYLPKHQAEIEAANKLADDASNAMIQLKTLDAALSGIHTGAWGDDVQSIRRGLASLGLSDAAYSGATKGDIATQLSTEVSALRARAASGGRTALGTFNIFRNVKPGLLSTDPRAQIKSLIPAYQRQLDYANFVNGYYGNGKNWNKLDAPTAFQAANPDQKYIDAAGLGGPDIPKPESFGLAGTAKFIGWHDGKPVFDVHGKKVMAH